MGKDTERLTTRPRSKNETGRYPPAAERVYPTWAAETGHLRGRKELYQGRFILLSDGVYSAVPVADPGPEETAWRHLSLAIRRDHECAHDFTRRLFGSMRNHLHGELLADYAGLVAATGRFRAAWFVRFLGLDTEPPRGRGRVHLYRGDPPLSDPAFRVLHTWVREAARRLERALLRFRSGLESTPDGKEAP